MVCYGMDKITGAKTYHKTECARVFKRYDTTCPRCQELASGAGARRGWGPSREQRDAQASAEIHAHFTSEKHRAGGCGVVCTFGEW